MTIDERFTQLERALAQHADIQVRLTDVTERVVTAVGAITERLTNIEARITNIETDIAIVKAWVVPPSENGSDTEMR